MTLSLPQSLLVRDDQSYYRSILAIARRQAYRVYIIYIYIPSSSHLPTLTFLLFTHLTYIRTSRFRHNNRPPQISASTALLIYDFIQLPSTTPPTHFNTTRLPSTTENPNLCRKTARNQTHIHVSSCFFPTIQIRYIHSLPTKNVHRLVQHLPFQAPIVIFSGLFVQYYDSSNQTLKAPITYNVTCNRYPPNV